MKVAILMSTYNGEKYLQSQIDSIKEQEYKDWNLYIRDDNSSDNTREIIEQNERIDSRIVWINKDEKDNVGVKMSFLKLMDTVNSDFYMFCDQDDIWLPNKVKMSLEYAKRVNSNVPFLLHTNLTTIDSEEKVINNKVHKKKVSDDLSTMLNTNSVTGCTVLFNNSLKEKMLSDYRFVDDMVMHDWWFALCAKTMGKIVYVRTPTILYRIHGGNVVGTDTSLLKRLNKLSDYEKELEHQKHAIRQSKRILKLHSTDMNDDSRRVIETFNKLSGMNFFNRMKTIKKFHFRKNSFLGSLSLVNMYAFKNSHLH